MSSAKGVMLAAISWEVHYAADCLRFVTGEPAPYHASPHNVVDLDVISLDSLYNTRTEKY